MAEISLVNINKRWGNVVGVKDFNLEIADKEFIVLLGPSGCGKTTTMRMIAGLEDPTEGDLIFDGQRINDLEPKDRDVAMVFQGYGLYPNLTVYENIRFPLMVRKVDPKTHDARVRQAADRVALGALLNRKPKELSGGQRQRVALARAIVREPKVFLMDEPLSNLDAKLRISTRAEIKYLQHELKVTTIYVTHDQIEAMTLAHRVVIMNHGVIQQIGTPTEIYNFPENKFVASFIGSPAMNLLEGTLENGRFKSSGIDVGPFTGVPDGEVTLGFRPEDAIVDVSGNNDYEGKLSSHVYSIELLGDATMVCAKFGDVLVSVKADKNFQTEIGTSVNFFVKPDHCALFSNNENGERIDHSAKG